MGCLAFNNFPANEHRGFSEFIIHGSSLDNSIGPSIVISVILVIRAIIINLSAEYGAKEGWVQCKVVRVVLFLRRTGATHRTRIRRIKKYQNKFKSWSRKIGMKIWYLIHGASQAPVGGSQNLDAALKFAELSVTHEDHKELTE